MVAMPKSESNTSCRRPSSMFSGLISRWMNFCSCAYCKASATCLTEENDPWQRNQAAFGIAAPQRATRGIVDHQKGHALLHIVIEDPHDARMDECGDGLGFLLEVLRLQLAQMRMQHFDGRLLVEPHGLSQVDLGIAPLTQ